MIRLERVSVGEWAAGGRAHALAEEARLQLSVPLRTARESALQVRAGGYLASAADGALVAAILVDERACLFQLDASFETDTELLAEAFRRTCQESGARSIEARSDDSLLLPFLLSVAPPGSLETVSRLYALGNCVHSLGRARTDVWREISYEQALVREERSSLEFTLLVELSGSSQEPRYAELSCRGFKERVVVFRCAFND